MHPPESLLECTGTKMTVLHVTEYEQSRKQDWPKILMQGLCAFVQVELQNKQGYGI